MYVGNGYYLKDKSHCVNIIPRPEKLTPSENNRKFISDLYDWKICKELCIGFDESPEDVRT